MANRRLKRMELSQECAEALEKHHLEFAKDVMGKNKQELVSLLGLYEPECEELLQRVAQSICPIPRSVSDAIRAKHDDVRFMPTGMAAFDATLRGGLPCGGITEVVGPAGAGKTQFCLQNCVSAIGEWVEMEYSAIYVDTESRFSPVRLREIARDRFPSLPALSLDRMVEHCIVYSVQSMQSLSQTLGQLEEVIIDKNVKLLVVDSVASLVRHEFGNSSLPSRQAELTKEAQTLKYLAETFSIPILVTNQVTTKYSEPCRPDKASHQGEIPHHPAAERDAFRDGEAFLTAALGPAWSHSVNTRVVLEQTPGTASGRLLTVAKSPIAPVTTIQFEIDRGGIKLKSEAMQADDNFWTMRIHAVGTAIPDGHGDPCNQVFSENATDPFAADQQLAMRTGV